MTSALRGREGGWSKCDDSTDRLREWDSDEGGRGSKNPKILRTSFEYRPFSVSILRNKTLDPFQRIQEEILCSIKE